MPKRANYMSLLVWLKSGYADTDLRHIYKLYQHDQSLDAHTLITAAYVRYVAQYKRMHVSRNKYRNQT